MWRCIRLLINPILKTRSSEFGSPLSLSYTTSIELLYIEPDGEFGGLLFLFKEKKKLKWEEIFSLYKDKSARLSCSTHIYILQLGEILDLFLAICLVGELPTLKSKLITTTG